jgi:hypothetical protein
MPAIPGQYLSALILMRYILSFREDKSIFFNGLDQMSALGLRRGEQKAGLGQDNRIINFQQ